MTSLWHYHFDIRIKMATLRFFLWDTPREAWIVGPNRHKDTCNNSFTWSRVFADRIILWMTVQFYFSFWSIYSFIFCSCFSYKTFSNCKLRTRIAFCCTPFLLIFLYFNFTTFTIQILLLYFWIIMHQILKSYSGL